MVRLNEVPPTQRLILCEPRPSPLAMKSCACCGKENEDAATNCDECGADSFKADTGADKERGQDSGAAYECFDPVLPIGSDWLVGHRTYLRLESVLCLAW